MKRFFFFLLLFFFCPILFAQVHTSYLWHLHQPVYWPENSVWSPAKYQDVRESHYLKTNGGNIYPDGKAHPLNDLEEIFSKDDRKAVYQWRAKDGVSTLLGFPEAGAQVVYSGALIENVNSLASAGQWGYNSGWQNNYITARNWQTSGGKPRMDIAGFSFHHVTSPLVSEKVLRKEIQTYRYIYQQTFGTSPDFSKGFWPAECSFSERIIKVLVEEGFEWSVIANSHLARTLADYPLSFGTSGCNIDPPNGADKVATTGVHWWSGQIDGRGGTFAAPYCYQAHKAQYVDPVTGQVFKITVVPMDDVLSYMNGYALMGTGEIDQYIAPYDNPLHPSMVLLAHDGDNAWGGGYDYYQNSVPQFAQACANKGYVPSTIQQFLANHPVPDDDVVHVEDGSWVNAANDWGHPQFINWLWPMYTAGYEFNPDGWTEDARNWAVLVAAENRVQMAEDLTGIPPVAEIVSPSPSSSNVAKAWHHLLPGFASDYMYYGTSLDMEVKQTLAANIAVGYADQVINAFPGQDNTPPNVFIPQRYPYNPGGIGFGPNYGYQQHQNSNDFYVWTFAYDVSGLQNVVLKYRLDEDGINPLTSHENDTYAGGAGVGQWQSITMTMRSFPAGNVTNNPEIDFFIMPLYIAGQYYTQVTGLSEKLVDYCVEATDTKGNICRTPIQHVYVGTYSGGGGGQATISWTPEEPDNNDLITIIVQNATQGAKLHWGVNGFNTPNQAYWPEGTYLFNGSGPAVETPLTGPNAQNQLILQFGPFNNPEQQVFNIGFVIHYNDGTWDNNNGQDYSINFGIGGNEIVQWIPAQPDQNETITITVNQATVGGKLHWGIDGWNQPNPVYWPSGSYLFNGTGPAVQSPMSGPNVNNQLSIQIGPFNNPLQEVTVVDFVISYDNGTWNNNNGQDYHITIQPVQQSGALSGSVINANNQAFISGAMLTMTDGVNSYSVISNNGIGQDHNFEITGIVPGIYNLTCSATGFEQAQVTGIEIVANQAATEEIALVPIVYPLPDGWEYDYTPVSHMISIPQGLAPLFNGIPLDYGDYIGVFYVNDNNGESCAGAFQWQQDEFVLAAFGDDGFTPEKDGFDQGDSLRWKVFKQSRQTEYSAIVTYNPAFPQSDGLFYGNGLSQIMNFESDSYIKQTIGIEQGWSGISLYVDPLQKNVETIFAPFGTDFIILASTTQFYYPATGVNTIGNWNILTGYKIKTEQGFVLELTGEEITDRELTLDSGWSLIPVLSDCGITAEEVLSQMPNLKAIKGVATIEVFWPEYGISTLDFLESGMAYWLAMNSVGSFTYPECDKKGFDNSSGDHLNLITPWNEVHFSGLSHLIALPSGALSTSGLLPGDMIGVFTPDGDCAGITEITSTDHNLVVIAFKDDETTTAPDGFHSSEKMTFKFFRPGTSQTGLLNIEFETGQPNRDYFVENGMSAAKNISLSFTGTDEWAGNEITIMPNPTDGVFKIYTTLITNDLTVEVNDLRGGLIGKYSRENQSNRNEFTLDLSELDGGIYVLKIYSEGSVYYSKIVIY